MTVWYNSAFFKMDANLYKGHIYGHWEQIIDKIGCLPLKIEQTGFMGNVTQIAIEYKEKTVEDSRFEIPEFKEVFTNQ